MGDFSSPYYPYEKVQEGYNSMRGMEDIPRKLLTYLMDMADKNGYIPADDNDRPRVRLMKMLYYDGENPLGQPLPTDAQKRSILFDPEKPVLNTKEERELHPMGYRLYGQSYWLQGEMEARTYIKCYVGNIIPNSPTREEIGITFILVANSNLDAAMRTKAYSKLVAMEQCIIESLHGVNIAGVGVVNYNRYNHRDAGSMPYHDEGNNLYRVLNMSLTWQEDNSTVVTDNCQ